MLFILFAIAAVAFALTSPRPRPFVVQLEPFEGLDHCVTPRLRHVREE